MDSLFENCTSLSKIPNISNWDVHSLKHMNKIFFNCSSVVSFPNISIWSISNDIKIDNFYVDSNSLINSSFLSEDSKINYSKSKSNSMPNDDGSQNSFSDNNKKEIYERINYFDKEKNVEKDNYYEFFYS